MFSKYKKCKSNICNKAKNKKYQDLKKSNIKNIFNSFFLTISHFFILSFNGNLNFFKVEKAMRRLIVRAKTCNNWVVKLR